MFSQNLAFRRHHHALGAAVTLLALMEQEGLYQKELAEALEIENATMVRLLDGLERQSFIER
ncbi:MarR family transcriptional regulator, partial [Brucella anthropi]|uniref:MarR family transcriptional regulator n=1 Tax=Brucella anthropi TaxID=529 RepID=UPI001F42D7E6